MATLISWQAGLFSAVTSTFIAQVQPQLQPDSGDETATLLRVLIYKIDNTTFGSDIPTLPQWAGPPRTIVQVQAILYASLVISLFAAFLAMVGKQWLNEYASVDTRGSTIKRCQDRQQKFDGTITWRFDYVMESLPLMLQGALFLLGCALSLYLWGINTIIASVVLGVTLLGVLFYGFIIVAGTASVNCPYQTPHARVFRYVVDNILPPISIMVSSVASSAASAIKHGSKSISTLSHCLKYKPQMCAIVFPLYFLALPALLIYDAGLFAVAIFRASDDLARRAYVWLHCIRRAYTWFYGARKAYIWIHGTLESGPKSDQLDIQCILWILRASVEKTVHLLALKLLATVTPLAGFSPTLISTCFDILIGSVVVVGDKAVVPQESEEIAELSARCCLRTLFHTNQPLSTFERMRKRYTRVFLPTTGFGALDSNHSLRTVHNVFYSLHPGTQWNDRGALAGLAHTLTNLANKHASESTHETFSDCLSIIAIDLGCNIPLRAAVHDERYFDAS